MFKDAVNMQIGGMVPLPRMQTGTGPMGIASVSPELFSSAEFMGEPLNQMSEAGAGIPGAGFFPEGNFGAPAVTDAGIVAGLEEMSVEPEVKENKLELAKQQAMSIFDQKFDEVMSVMQAQMATGGMPMQDMEMILSDEIEVMEGQAEATVKEAMNLPEEVDLIPAEVAQSYLEKARMIVSGPKQEPSMDMPMDMGDQAVQKMVIGTGPTGVQPEEEDPLSIIEEMRQQSIEREEERRKREVEAIRGRQTDLDKKIRAGDFRNEFMTDWQKLDDLKERVKDVAERKASYESPISPALSTMGGKYLSAMKMIPERAGLAGDEAVLKYEIEIEKLKQAEQQALLQGDAAMLREVYKQGQKIEDQLSNTLMQNIGDIERQAITETGDILTKQIGDQKGTPSREDEKYYLSILNDPSKKGTVEYGRALQQMGVTEAVVEGAKNGAKNAINLWTELGAPDTGDVLAESMDVSARKVFFREEYPSFYSWLKTQGIGEIFPDNSGYFAYLFLQHGISQQMDFQQGSQQQGPAFDIDAQDVPDDVIMERIENGTYASGQVLLLGEEPDGSLITRVVP
jgi:hypothetical protein